MFLDLTLRGRKQVCINPVRELLAAAASAHCSFSQQVTMLNGLNVAFVDADSLGAANTDL